MLTTEQIMDKYYETYSTGDYETVPFSDDILFESILGKFEGKEIVIKHLIDGHGGGMVKEKLIPLNMIIMENRVAVELDAELSFEEDLPIFLLESLRRMRLL